MSKRRVRSDKPVRLAKDILALLDEKRARGESYNKILRKELGMTEGGGTHYLLKHGYPMLTFATEEEAKGAAVVLAVRKKTKKLSEIVKTKEIL